MNGNLDVLELILKHGGDCNAVCQSGNTALHLAVLSAYNRHFEEIVSALLKYGSDVNVSGRNGRTALGCAISYGSSAMCKILLDHGADISARDVNGCNALHIVSMRQPRSIPIQNKIMRMLLSGSNDVKMLDALHAFDHGSIGSGSDSEDDVPSFTPVELADLMDKPILAAMMEEAETRCASNVEAVETAKLARTAYEKRAAKLAFAMGQHKRVGADSQISTLAPDVMQLILKHV